MDNIVGPDGGANPPASTTMNESELDDYIDDITKNIFEFLPSHIRERLSEGDKLELVQDLQGAVEIVIRDHFTEIPG